MEKQRINTNAKSFRRLLIIFASFCLFSPLGAQSIITQAQANALKIVPSENQNLYTKSDIKFEVIIPKTDSSSVILQGSAAPMNATLRSMRKNQEYGDNPGTKIELWYYFEKKGEYKIPPLQLLISNRRRAIQFEPVTVTDNPQYLSPRIVILFPDEKTFYSDEPLEVKPAKNGKKSDVPPSFFDWKTGEKIPFSVCLQYTVQLVQFDWEIPVDSIFTQTKTYDILEIKYREKTYSDELIPVADFEWTSLSEGQKSFPKIKLTATGYNGYRNEIIIPEFTINFTKNTGSGDDGESEISDFFDRSFELYDSLQKSNSESDGEDEVSSDSVFNHMITVEDCEILAELRHKERTGLFAWKHNIKERADFEAELGINNSINEFFIGWFYLSAIIILLCVFFLIIFIKKHVLLPSIVTTGILIFVLVFFIFVSIQMGRVYGISKGCKISSIPEENAKAESRIEAGNRVLISEQAGQWIYIQLGETGGWCRRSDVIFIN